MPCKTHILIHILNDGASMIINKSPSYCKSKGKSKALSNRGLVFVSNTKNVYNSVYTLSKLRNFGENFCNFVTFCAIRHQL